MKSPLKYSKWPIVLYGILSFLIFGLTLNSYYLSGGVVTLERIFWLIFGVGLSMFAGRWIAIKFTGTIFHRQVDHSTDPSSLQALQTYWLNGETPAVFIGTLDHPGTYLFHILGLNKKNDLHDTKALSFDQVRVYVSTQKESNGKTY
mgnify:CR=1 FL=1